jgi:hypothetical protein
LGELAVLWALVQDQGEPFSRKPQQLQLLPGEWLEREGMGQSRIMGRCLVEKQSLMSLNGLDG